MAAEIGSRKDVKKADQIKVRVRVWGEYDMSVSQFDHQIIFHLTLNPNLNVYVWVYTSWIQTDQVWDCVRVGVSIYVTPIHAKG